LWPRKGPENLSGTVIWRARLRRPLEDETVFKAFLGAEADLIRNIHGIAEVAGLNRNEVGYLLGRVAETKGVRGISGVQHRNDRRVQLGTRNTLFHTLP
jgi:hypothetical protein